MTSLHVYSVDLDRDIYHKLRTHCELIGTPMREALTLLINEFLAGRRLAVPTPPQPEKRRDDPAFWERHQADDRRGVDRYPLPDRRGMGGGAHQRGTFSHEYDASVDTALRGLR
jgi:hypothetical protein